MKKTMAAAEAKTHFLSLLDQVEQSRQEIIITKRGRAVARLVPLAHPPKKKPLHQRIRIVGDIVSPVDTGWNE
jgi:prevent-host-death family protein